MSMSEIITTLHEFLTQWLTDAGFREQYDGDLEAAMDAHGFEDVDPAELMECLPLVAEDLPLAYQRSVFDYMNTVNDVNSGGHTVNQGGDTTANQGTAALAASAQEGPLPGEDPGDAVVRHIYNIQNVYESNYSYIEDNDVNTTITANGDVDLEQNVASGDGAFAGDNAEGVVMGDNFGINAGDDVTDAQVNNVDGDGNVVGNEIGEDANVLTGEFTGNFVGGDAEDSAFVAGDNYGQNLADVEDSNVIGGDSGIAVAGDGNSLDGANVNVGDGQQFNLDNSAATFGDGDATLDQSQVHITDSYNTDNSVDDSYNTDIDDSYNTDNSTDVDDSYNTDSYNTDNSVDVDDSYNTEDSYNDDSYNDDSFNETDVDVDAGLL